MANDTKAVPPVNLPTRGGSSNMTNQEGNNNQANITSQSQPQINNQAELNSSVQKTNKVVQDISANQTETNKINEVPKQAEINPPSQPPVELKTENPKMQELEDTTVESLEKRSRIIRLIILIASALIIVGLVIAGIYVYDNWLKNASIDTTDTSQQDTPEQTQEDTNNNQVDTNDRDEDSLPNDWEEKYGLNPDDSSDALKDNDFDGLNNIEEYKYGTDPKNSDTDGDGYADGQEVKAGFNPAGTGQLAEETTEQSSNTAFVAGNWSGSMQGKYYSFSNLNIILRSDSNLSIDLDFSYNDEIINNSGAGEFEVEREVNSFKSQIDMQGVAKSGSGTYLFGINGTISKSNDEISGTWYIIPSKLTAPWMIQDKGTFSFKKQ